MATPLELSKAAQEQILATIKQGQELALTGVEVWASTMAPLVKAGRTPIATDLPTSEELVSNSLASPRRCSPRRKRSPRRSSPPRPRSSRRPLRPAPARIRVFRSAE